jgi:hypothetical protein
MKGRGERVTVIAEPGMMEIVRDIVFWTPGETVASFVDRALQHEVERLVKERGSPFPPRTRSLRMGRPARDPAEAAE